MTWAHLIHVVGRYETEAPLSRAELVCALLFDEEPLALVLVHAQQLVLLQRQLVLLLRRVVVQRPAHPQRLGLLHIVGGDEPHARLLLCLCVCVVREGQRVPGGGDGRAPPRLPPFWVRGVEDVHVLVLRQRQLVRRLRSVVVHRLADRHVRRRRGRHVARARLRLLCLGVVGTRVQRGEARRV